MNEIPKIMSTLRFISAGFLHGVPANPVFKDANRRIFHQHLAQIRGINTQSSMWLRHLRSINHYCDTHDVALLDTEKRKIREFI